MGRLPVRWIGSVLLVTAACGSTSTSTGDGGAGDASSDAAAVGDGGALASLGKCAACNPATELCKDDYTGAGRSCAPIPPECASDRSCSCGQMHFKCGITTSCSVAAGELLVMTCQPD